MYTLIYFLWVSFLYTTNCFIFLKKNIPSQQVMYVTWSDGELDWGFEDETIIIEQPIKTYVNYPYLSHKNKLKILKNINTIKETVFDKETIYDNINEIIEQNIEYIQYLPPLLIPSAIIIILIEQKSIEINKNFFKKLLFFFIILFFKSPKHCL